MPQYFAYHAEEAQRAAEYARVDAIAEEGANAWVTLVNDAGEEQQLVIAKDSLQVSQGDDVAEGDVVGVTRHWAAGPLLWGLWTTLWISVLSGAFGLAIGLFTGLCRLSPNPTLRDLSTVYVELVRGTPLLVQIFIFYFFIGTVLDLSREFAGVAALALFTGAYVGEIVRAGVQSIARGQNEAARSLGLSSGQSMRHVILPQAFKRVLPPLAGQFISLVKDTSLVSVIAITELTKSGREAITTSFSTFEIWFCVAALYLVINLPLSQIANRLERRLAQSD
ncbi:ABC transporter permease [Aquipseudomonas alcaligenes OT 69]|nr:ABC transporter permease [Pseudomonas alcaligenes OT 69]